MQSTINNSNNSNNCDANKYEKNEHYTEFGLAKGQKKDSKARNHLAAKQSEEREKKLAEQVSLLPNKMQAKLAAVKEFYTGKTNIDTATKIFHIRQKKTQDRLLDDYEEDLLAEDDAQNETQNEAYEIYCEKVREEESLWDMMCLSDEIQNYEAELAKGDLTIILSEYKAGDKNYQSDLAMWLRYGLTEAQWDANRQYSLNVDALNDFYQEADYQSHPDYEMRLKTAIKNFEDDFDAQQKEQDLKDEQNNWWKGTEIVDDVNPYEDFDPDLESFNDWCERNREEAFEDARQNAIDDNRED